MWLQSNSANGLAVHMSRKHPKVIELKGSNDFEESEENDIEKQGRLVQCTKSI